MSNEKKTVSLRSGGGETYSNPTMTLSLIADFVALDKQDREFVFGILDAMKEYESPAPKPEPVHVADPAERKMELVDPKLLTHATPLSAQEAGATPLPLPHIHPTEVWEVRNLEPGTVDATHKISVTGSRKQIVQRVWWILKTWGYAS